MEIPQDIEDLVTDELDQTASVSYHKVCELILNERNRCAELAYMHHGMGNVYDKILEGNK